MDANRLNSLHASALSAFERNPIPDVTEIFLLEEWQHDNFEISFLIDEWLKGKSWRQLKISEITGYAPTLGRMARVGFCYYLGAWVLSVIERESESGFVMEELLCVFYDFAYFVGPKERATWLSDDKLSVLFDLFECLSLESPKDRYFECKEEDLRAAVETLRAEKLSRNE